jgi:hypothetical protein
MTEIVTLAASKAAKPPPAQPDINKVHSISALETMNQKRDMPSDKL